MLTLYLTELRDDMAAEHPNVPAKKTGALGELLRLHMMEACGAPYDLAKGKYGKPYSPSRPDISYNISHSARLAVGALLTDGDGEVGIDIEYIDRENSSRHKRIADRFFTEAERAAIADDDDAVREFYRTWTRKEAYLKYKGVGMTLSLSGVDVTKLTDVTFDCRTVSDSKGGEYAFCVCVRRGVSIDNIEIAKIF